jgi:DNA-binding transcriptional LysR family regulator
MNINDMESFLEVYKSGSITKAADKLYVSPQGLSVVIKRMEKELNANLFKRTKNGVLVTEYGQLFYQRAINIVSEYNKTRSEINALKLQNMGYLKVCSAFGIIRHLSPEYILNFSKSHPKIHFDYVEFPDLLVEDYILNGKADIGLTPNPDPRLFSITKIFTTKICFVTHNKSKFYNRKGISLAEMCEEPLVIESNHFKIHGIIDRECSRLGVEPKIMFNTSGFSLCHKMCSNNEGNTVCLDFIFDDMKYHNIRKIPFKENMKWEACCVTKKDVSISKAVREFINYTVDWSKKRGK